MNRNVNLQCFPIYANALLSSLFRYFVFIIDLPLISKVTSSLIVCGAGIVNTGRSFLGRTCTLTLCNVSLPTKVVAFVRPY